MFSFRSKSAFENWVFVYMFKASILKHMLAFKG